MLTGVPGREPPAADRPAVGQDPAGAAAKPRGCTAMVGEVSKMSAVCVSLLRSRWSSAPVFVQPGSSPGGTLGRSGFDIEICLGHTKRQQRPDTRGGGACACATRPVGGTGLRLRRSLRAGGLGGHAGRSRAAGRAHRPGGQSGRCGPAGRAHRPGGHSGRCGPAGRAHRPGGHSGRCGPAGRAVGPGGNPGRRCHARPRADAPPRPESGWPRQPGGGFVGRYGSARPPRATVQLAPAVGAHGLPVPGRAAPPGVIPSGRGCARRSRPFARKGCLVR